MHTLIFLLLVFSEVRIFLHLQIIKVIYCSSPNFCNLNIIEV